MKTIIHVNQHIIKRNQKLGEFEPPLTIKTYKENRKAKRAIIYHNGVEVARIVYEPERKLKCGARCWIETYRETLNAPIGDGKKPTNFKEKYEDKVENFIEKVDKKIKNIEFKIESRF